MATRGRTPSISHRIAAVGAITTLALGSLLVPTIASAAESDLVFTPTYSGPTPGVFLRVQVGEGGLPGGIAASFVSWTLTNPTASPVVLTASKAGNSVPAVVEVPAYTVGYVTPDEYVLLVGESMTISVAGTGTVSVERSADGADPLGVQTLGDPSAQDFGVFVTGFDAAAAAGAGIDVTFGYQRMAYQPMWLEDQGESREAAVLLQYSGDEGSLELGTGSTPALVAQTVVLGATEGESRTGTITTHLPVSVDVVQTLSFVQTGFAPAPTEETLAQGTFRAATVVPLPGDGGATDTGDPATLPTTGADEDTAFGGLLAGGAALLLGAALVLTTRRRSARMRA